MADQDGHNIEIHEFTGDVFIGHQEHQTESSH
jgi:hypothetical protein